MPTGAARIAPPLVVPKRPVISGDTPSCNACSADFVDGPSRSSDPLAFIAASHAIRSSAYRWTSMSPSSAIRRLASSTACSVSSVMLPARMPGAIGCQSTASRNPVTGPP